MSDPFPPHGAPEAVPEAKVEARGRLSIVWLIPIVAAAVGAFVAYRAFSSRGPEITIRFETAEGIEAGKTAIKFKDFQVGLVDDVELAPDLSGIICHARMVPGADKWLTDKTRFWIVKPRIAGGQVTGLGTLLSGSYIGVDPVTEGKRERSYRGLEVPPIVTTNEPGREFVLRSDRAGAIDVGSPVLFREITVGSVLSSEIDPKDDFVTTRIFVRAPYDARVHPGSRFWNASGVNLSVTANGLQVATHSLVSILIGGIAFDTPEGESEATVAAANAEFPLYASQEDAEARHFTHTVPYLLYFDQSVRGLAVGAPVEFRGIQIGDVTDVRLEFDPKEKRFRIPVMIEVEPERFTDPNISNAERRAALDHMVASGLRAQLKSGNLLTGQLIVSLDLFPDAKPAEVVWNAPVPVFPTIPTPLEEITTNLTRIVQRLSALPLEQIGNDLRDSLASLRVTLAGAHDVGPALKSTLTTADQTLGSANALIGPGSGFNSELSRALFEVSDAARSLALAAQQIQTQPQSLIFGKKGSQ
jgi:paraquat-inducible protein B